MGVRRLPGARRRDERERAPTHGSRRRPRPPEGDDRFHCPPAVRLRNRGNEGDAYGRRARGDLPRIRRRRRRDGPERRGERGSRRAARLAGDPRDDIPRREDRRAGRRAVGRQGRHHARAVRAEPGRCRADRGPRRRLHARRDADRSRRRRAPGAVAESHLQRGDEPRRRAHGSHARSRLRACRGCAPS